MNNSHLSTPDISRLRRHSKPSPSERDELKKQNAMTSPIHHNIVTAMDSTTHQGLTSQIHVTSPNTQQYPPPSTQPISFALQPTDLSNIVLQLKSVLRDEITNIIKSVFKDEIENYIKDSLHTVTNEIEVLKLDNTKLKADIDALEQYGRRELIRLSGIVEKSGENTTYIVRNIVKSVDKDLPEGDIIRSHRVGKLYKPANGPPKPRQIIVRLRDSTTKRRILKASKGLKDGEHFAHVNINEDLTKTRNTLAYRARQLKKKRFISQTWTLDGKIFVRNNRELVTTITTDYRLKRYILDNFPNAMEIAYPPAKE